MLYATRFLGNLATTSPTLWGRGLCPLRGNPSRPSPPAAVTPRTPPASRDEEMYVGAMAAAASLSLSLSSSAPSSGSWERAGKRFPILGPTRQDTELYFRRRRSARHRIRTASRPLVTRSADRVVLADYSPTRLTCTTFTTLSTSSPTTAPPTSTNCTHHPKSFRHVDIDTNSSHNTDPSSGHGPEGEGVTTSLPVFEHVAGSSPKKGAKPVSAFARSTSSSGVVRTSLPSFERSATYHGGFGGSELVRSAGKKYEIPIKFLSETGQIRTSKLTHRVNKTAGENQKQGQGQKTLQPSKYGFHRRSKSPTFKRLVEVAEKLQNVVLPDPNSDFHTSKCYTRVRSLSCARFPAVAAADTADGGGRSGGGEEDEHGSEEEATYLHPHDFFSSLPYSIHKQNPREETKHPKHGPSARNSAKRRSINASSRKAAPHTSSTQTHDSLTIGWGAWEVDSAGAESGIDPLSPTLPLDLPPTDSHTELHLFLPRLAETASEESGSGAASKASPDRHRPRLSHNPRASSQVPRGKTAPQGHHPHTSLRPPQHPHYFRVAAGERSSRPQSRRFSFPVRVLRRDRTPKRRSGGVASAGEVCESYEPFIKGEHLKEKLEDFPTLISLDQERC